MAIELYKRNRNLTFNLILCILVSIIMVMVHESFVFIAAPVIVWIMYKSGDTMYRMSIYSLAVLVAGLVLVPLHTPQQIAILDTYFSQRGIDWIFLRNFMMITRVDTLGMSIRHLMLGSILIYIGLLIPITAYLVHCRLIRSEYRWLLAGQVLGTIAICLIAIDYGRWISFGLVAYFICLISYGGWQEYSLQIRDSAKERFLFFVMIGMFILINPPHYVDGRPLDRIRNYLSFPQVRMVEPSPARIDIGS
jgi:hypothetical protein